MTAHFLKATALGVVQQTLEIIEICFCSLFRHSYIKERDGAIIFSFGVCYTFFLKPMYSMLSQNSTFKKKSKHTRLGMLHSHG